ncbi:MAG: protein translocase subunit SecF [Treponema sp.]|jgi:preprotein translocase subunit SecF|nr:protein translocase subunit SecF [Treponema sp.]
MKINRIIRFSRFFIPAAIISLVLVIVGISGFVMNRGFNLGVDFQAGLLQEVQIASTAFRLTYDGPGTASVSLSQTALTIVMTGIGVEEASYSFPFATYPTKAALVAGIRQIAGVEVEDVASPAISSLWLIQSAQSSPILEVERPFVVHYLPLGAPPVSIEDVRASLEVLGMVAVQNLGAPDERRFMVRMEASEIEGMGVPTDRVVGALEAYFGEGTVVVNRSDFVGARFARDLTDQAAILLTLTLLLMLLYMTFRFKLQYAVGAIIGIVYDGIIIVAFVALTRMEFNTITIAAILTTLGYSTNNTIVVFDRIRENLRIFPDDSFIDIIDRSLTGTLGRTIITTFTTMLAVLSLFIFATGAMQDFALALMVGMASGVYTTTFIASGFVYFWQLKKVEKQKRRMSLVAAGAKA